MNGHSFFAALEGLARTQAAALAGAHAIVEVGGRGGWAALMGLRLVEGRGGGGGDTLAVVAATAAAAVPASKRRAGDAVFGLAAATPPPASSPKATFKAPSIEASLLGDTDITCLLARAALATAWRGAELVRVTGAGAAAASDEGAAERAATGYESCELASGSVGVEGEGALALVSLSIASRNAGAAGSALLSAAHGACVGDYTVSSGAGGATPVVIRGLADALRVAFVFVQKEAANGVACSSSRASPHFSLFALAPEILLAALPRGTLEGGGDFF